MLPCIIFKLIQTNNFVNSVGALWLGQGDKLFLCCFIFFNRVNVCCIPYGELPSAEGCIKALHASLTSDHLTTHALMMTTTAMLL
jgi:hypothetical protein